MKKIASLLLLPLLLAACGTQSAPQQTAHSFANGMQTESGNEYVAAFEAKVQNDLEALGLAGSLTPQVVVAGKSYLNVLKVNDSTARAYIKTTYPSSTSCTVDWGDGSITTAQTPTPTNVSTERQNHVYASSGTYTIKLTCGTDIKISSFKAIAANAELNLFDSLDPQDVPYFVDEGYTAAPMAHLFPLIEKGFKFESESPFILTGGVIPVGHKGMLIDSYGRISADNGSTFDIKSITAGGFFPILGADSVTLSAYDANNMLIASEQFVNDGYRGYPMEIRQLNWSRVKYLEITDGPFLNIDDMSATINQ
ncbi:hypothetical protein GCM10008959_39190 [Deinococcus seoulensis]|uniref:PKD domain-containing protein n=1 Tax=Deinococcus seoulensis TaxID=1837379 RepID=A0ABQ2RWX9_9DEIO|nr:PKD domain-containing protein [Deinococcus seoulensis]GGR74112.1 hypothetical protein GCM10008959_39190 [Deinococcus seoulensis]